MEKYLYYQGKKLRYGFTTGSTATAAAVAGAELLINGNYSDCVEIALPSGKILKIEIKQLEILDKTCICSVIKDAGDDPDITNGIEIFAKVKKIDMNEIRILGGKGVGVVTKKGLPIEQGKPAINPTPLSMIRNNLDKYIENQDFGLEVEISAPQGEEIAKRTLNSRLGIEGGISILGTTGIVKPMSEEAFRDSIAIELDVAKLECGEQEIVFTFGNFGKRYAIEKLGIDEKRIVVISNFVGDMIEKACEKSVKKILFIGNIGKFVKVAGGIFHTHSRVSDARLEILASNLILCDEKRENILKVLNSNTTEEAIDYIEKIEVFNLLAKKAKEKCEAHARRCGRDLKIETLIFSNEKGELGRSSGFEEKNI